MFHCCNKEGKSFCEQFDYKAKETPKGVQDEMDRKTGIISTIIGIISSTLGIIGASCVVCAPVCASSCCLGPVIALIGAGLIGFLRNYSAAFIIIGGFCILLGAFLIVRRKKLSSGCCGQNNDTK